MARIKTSKGTPFRKMFADKKNFPSAGDSPTFSRMDAVQQEVTDIFIRTKALLQGHFVLRSGLHSGHFFQCAQVCQDMPAVERLGTLLKQKLGALAYDTVLAPAMGGLVIGQEVARQSKSRFIFAEKENNVLVLRRGFTFKPGEKVLVVEDVITRGGRVQECLEIVRKMGGTAVAVAVLVDRSAGQAKFDVPTYSLLEMSYPTYPADQLPPELARIPASKPGS
jgi:orotate phosphoribosyltransferase